MSANQTYLTPGEKTNTFLMAWLCIALIAVVSMVFITPPFQTPDEEQHFFRAYQLSEGTLLAKVEHGVSGGDLPLSLLTLSSRYMRPPLWTEPTPPVRPLPLAHTLTDLHQPLDVLHRGFLAFPLQAFYAPMSYAGEIVAMNLGRHAGAGPLTLFYLARLANGLCALAVLFWALRLLPFGRELVGFIALLPMAVSLYGSCSADAMVIATASLFTALVLNRMASATWSVRDSLIAVVCAITFCSLKPVYLPIVLLGFAGAFYTGKRVAILKHHAWILGLTLIVTLAWFRIASFGMVSVQPGTNVGAQISNVFHAPFLYVLTIAHTLRWNHFFYIQMVGLLGWLSIVLPMAAYLLPPLALIAAWGSEQRLAADRPARLAGYGFGLIALSSVLLMSALYVNWTPVGKNVIEGVQGRYFLPLTPLAALLFLSMNGRKRYWSQRTTQVVILVLIVLEAWICLSTTAQRYAVF